MHAPVLLDEAIEALAIKPNGIYIDGTFGRGGHSQLILSRLDEQGKLIAFDKDVSAVAVGKMIQDKRFCIEHASFSQLQQRLQQIGIRSIDGVLLDLGCLPATRRCLSWIQFSRDWTIGYAHGCNEGTVCCGMDCNGERR